MKTLYDKIAPYLRSEPTLYLENRTRRQICLAISAAFGSGHITSAQRKWLAGKVHKGLGSSLGDLEDWLLAEGLLDTISHLSPYDRYKQVQAYRHRWLKHLCEEYERENTVR